MKASVDRLNAHCRSQLDSALELCGLAFDCCEQLRTIQAEALRGALAQAGEHQDGVMRGELTGLAAGLSRVTADHWQAWLDCGTDFQKKWLAGLQNCVPTPPPTAK